MDYDIFRFSAVIHDIIDNYITHYHISPEFNAWNKLYTYSKNRQTNVSYTFTKVTTLLCCNISNIFAYFNSICSTRDLHLIAWEYYLSRNPFNWIKLSTIGSSGITCARKPSCDKSPEVTTQNAQIGYCHVAFLCVLGYLMYYIFKKHSVFSHFGPAVQVCQCMAFKSLFLTLNKYNTIFQKTVDQMTIMHK